MWGGRFDGGPSAVMQEINASIPFDKRLWKQDITLSLAHVKMLSAQGIIESDDADKIIVGLEQVAEEFAQNGIEDNLALEDIHMTIEARLTEIIGPVAGRLHTARSRNDQVATSFRLWVRDAIDAVLSALQTLQQVIVKRADENADMVMPGFTHLQVAQPVTLGHHLMAYYAMLARDIDRFESARKRLNVSPLGAAALAGTGFNLNRDMTANALGFDAPMGNSLDAVSDRDFALDYLSAASQCAIHLSRMAEEIIIWASQPYGFVSMSDQWSTGSSIMPQKRNPDAAELVRGHSGRIMGNLHSLMVTMKGLPLAYSKDMQNDKPPVFEAHDLFGLCIVSMSGMIETLTFNADNMHKAASSGFSTATDLADWLVRDLNIPFREAHHITGAAVRHCEDNDIALSEISAEILTSIDSRLEGKQLPDLSVEGSVNSRISYGGTSPLRVREMIAVAKQECGL